MDWRREVEQLFLFNPNVPIDPAEIAKVRAAMAIRRNAMQADLLKGIRDLETLRAEALTRRRSAIQHQGAYLAFKLRNSTGGFWAGLDKIWDSPPVSSLSNLSSTPPRPLGAPQSRETRRP